MTTCPFAPILLVILCKYNIPRSVGWYVAHVASALRFEASLADYAGVERSIEVREDTLVDLHNGIQKAFGWRDTTPSACFAGGRDKRAGQSA